MLRTLDASKLALTKLRTRKIRLAATIIVAGLLFGIVVFGLTVLRASMASIERFGRDTMSTRYLLAYSNHNENQSDLFYNPPQDAKDRILALHKQHIADKKAAAKALGVEYDEKSEEEPITKINQDDSGSLNRNSWAVKTFLKQHTADKNPLKPERIDAAAKPFGSSTAYRVQDVGGLAGLRDWLDEKRLLFTAEKRTLLREKGLKSPRGILLVGVPGCGKSLSAKAISANWKLPLYRLDFATVQGSYVGQSEQQLRDALLTAENVAPCILWIDEIEKGLSGAGSSNDGGVSTRMVGQFLFWLQECRKQVFVVATANDVSMLPSELLRRGRFDELFFIDLPTADERYDILRLYMRKYLELDFAGAFADTRVAMTDGFTGADLESTVRDLAYRVIANPEFKLNEENLRTAFGNVVPLSETAPEKIAAIRDWGRERAVPASGRPIGSETALKKSAETRTRRVLV